MKQIKKIAIQGYEGAFHEIAARHYFSTDPILIVPADEFKDVVQLVEMGAAADIGIMAIENSIAGSLMPNYSLINSSSLKIIGEIYLRIEQNLLVLPGVNISDLTEVHSHYMAIAQCQEYFRAYPHIKLVETKDTAASAHHIAKHGLKHIGAIASDLAAEMYGLTIWSAGIETNKLNYTRFLILDNEVDSYEGVAFDKMSTSFSVSHDSGSLYQALGILHDFSANMTKIQSTPIAGKPWEYLFFVDFELSNHEASKNLLNELSKVTIDLKILGQYKSGKHYEN